MLKLRRICMAGQWRHTTQLLLSLSIQDSFVLGNVLNCLLQLKSLVLSNLKTVCCPVFFHEIVVMVCHHQTVAILISYGKHNLWGVQFDQEGRCQSLTPSLLVDWYSPTNCVRHVKPWCLLSEESIQSWWSQGTLWDYKQIILWPAFSVLLASLFYDRHCHVTRFWRGLWWKGQKVVEWNKFGTLKLHYGDIQQRNSHKPVDTLKI